MPRLVEVGYFDKNRSKENDLTTAGDEIRQGDLAAIFKALADPNRLAIFQLVRERGGEARTVEEAARSISRIAAEFDLTLSTVSHHIKELRNAGLIRCDKVGQTVYCTPDPRAIEAIERFIGEGEA